MTSNNNKCNEHITEDIFVICIQCDYTPVCMKCIVGKGAHNKHDIGEIDSETVGPILKEFQTITIPKLNESLKQNNAQLVEYDNQLNQLEAEYTQHTNQIKSTFQKLHNNMTSVERDLIRQLDTTLNENKEMHSIQHSKIDSKLIDMLNTTFIYNGDNNNNQHNYIDILKLNHQYKKLLSENNNSSLSPFKKSQLNENTSNIDEINNSIKSLFAIKTTHSNDEIKQQIQQQTVSLQKPTDPTQQTPVQQPVHQVVQQAVQQIPPYSKAVKWLNENYVLCREGVILDKGTRFAADSLSIISNVSFNSNPVSLLLLDGFNDSLGLIPKSIQDLYIFDIKLQLVPGTIPNNIKYLIFCDGFSQTITKGIIPSSVTHLYLGNIIKPLDEDSIPNTVKNIFKSPSFKHSIPSNITPSKWGDYVKYKYL